MTTSRTIVEAHAYVSADVEGTGAKSLVVEAQPATGDAYVVGRTETGPFVVDLDEDGREDVVFGRVTYVTAR